MKNDKMLCDYDKGEKVLQISTEKLVSLQADTPSLKSIANVSISGFWILQRL